MSGGWRAPLFWETVQVAAESPCARHLRHFIDVFRGAAEPLSSGADATRTLGVTLAVNVAAETGRAVDV